MILPLSDAPNPKGTPIVTWSLIAVNVLVYLLITWPLSQRPVTLTDPGLRDYIATVREVLPASVSDREILENTSDYDVYTFRKGFRPADPRLFPLLRSLFLHGGLAHLLGNMLFLWIYGDNVEHRLGRWRFLLYYLLTGVAATLFYTLFALNSKLPLVGASGAISGVLGFYFLWFPRNKVRLFVFLFPFFVNVVQIPARFVLGFYLLLDNLLPFLLAKDAVGGGVAHGAHIGGFIAGLGIAWFMNQRELAVKPRDFRQSGPPSEAPLDELRSAMRHSEMDRAARAYFALPPEQSRRFLMPAEMLALGDWLSANGHPDAAFTIYRHVLRDCPRGPGLAEAHVGLGMVQLEARGQATAAYQHFLQALDLDPAPETFTRAQAGLDAVARRQKYLARGQER